MDPTEKQAKILMVDDDPFQIMVMKAAVACDNYIIIEADNGEQALTLFNEHLPEIVILDIEMPVMDGYEACEKIRTSSQGSLSAILIVTGMDDSFSINKAYMKGATDFISKPFNLTIIRQRIKYILRSIQNIRKLNYLQSRSQAIIQALPDTLLYFDQNKDCIPDFSGLEEWRSYPDKIKNEFLKVMSSLTQIRQSSLFEFKLEKKDAPIQYQEARVVLGEDKNYVALLRDITERKEFEKKLWSLAYYDTLTNLPNRAFLIKRIQQLVSTKNTNPFMLMLINLDSFKAINAAYGNHFGDLLLKQIAERIQGYVKSIQIENIFISRYDRDEFAVILSCEKDSVETEHAQQLLDVLSEPMFLEHHEVYLTSSIGISVFPKSSKDVETLLKLSSVAMHWAHKEGKNCYVFFESHMNADSIKKIDFENKLRKAFSQDEFVLHYQPQYNLKTGELVGAEALVRWIHPELGIVSPLEFIPIIEELGLANQLGERVFRIGLCALKRWLDAGLKLDSLSINLSSSQFSDINFSSMITGLLEEFSMDGSRINVEITESMFVNKNALTLQNLDFLHNLNIAISIDDFGIGYSSLSYLTAFPVSHLKIDRQFINNLLRSKSDQNLVKAIIQMAHALELKVVAEGIETKEQHDMVVELGSDYLQGFYYSLPLPETEFVELLNNKSNNMFSNVLRTNEPNTPNGDLSIG